MLTTIVHTLLLSLFANGDGPVAPVVRVELEHGHYLTTTVGHVEPDDRPPLLICLHGTNTDAADILRHWRSMEWSLPLVIVAPQSAQAGWSDTDLPLLNRMRDHLFERPLFDPQRVLLAGHSAGGAMVMHLAYCERFPASALACTANYVPPTVKPEHVRARTGLPVCYAVGEDDINRDRMRKGLSLLRDNGASATVFRPSIGHRLDRAVGAQVAAWFEDRNRRAVEDMLDGIAEAESNTRPGPLLAKLEEFFSQQRTHFADQIERGRFLYERMAVPAHLSLARAKQLKRNSQLTAAYDLLIEVESLYIGSAVAREAHTERVELASRPELQPYLACDAAAQQAIQANRCLKACYQALIDKHPAQAKKQCIELLRLYPDTAAAAEAQRLLEKLRSVPLPP